jgi:Concanavalin A-like lectin/glucanases superfamily
MKTLRFSLCFTAMFAVILTAQAQSFLTNGLVAYYPFNGSGHDCAFDNNLSFIMNGDNVSAHYGIDRFGNSNNALSFQEQRCFAISINTKFAPLKNNFTMSIWATASDGGGVLIAETPYQRKEICGTGSGIGLLMSATNCIVKSSSSGEAILTADLAGNNWHHLAVTFTNCDLSLFVDGIQVKKRKFFDECYPSCGYEGINSYSGGDLVETAGGGVGGKYDFQLHYDYWSPHKSTGKSGDELYFQGSISDYRIYNCALTENEVASLYQTETNREARSNAVALVTAQHDARAKAAADLAAAQARLAEIEAEKEQKRINHEKFISGIKSRVISIVILGIIWLPLRKIQAKKTDLKKGIVGWVDTIAILLLIGLLVFPPDIAKSVSKTNPNDGSGSKSNAINLDDIGLTIRTKVETGMAKADGVSEGCRGDAYISWGSELGDEIPFTVRFHPSEYGRDDVDFVGSYNKSTGKWNCNVKQ